MSQVIELTGLSNGMTRKELLPLIKYTSTGYIIINPDAERGIVTKEIEEMDRIFKYSSWPRKAIVFRGSTNNEYLKMRPGFKFKKRSFWSTSRSKLEASKFGHIMIMIRLKKEDRAIDIQPISRHDYEKEVLIDRNTIYEIEWIDLITNTIVVKIV